jgi:hypothetical protein
MALTKLEKDVCITIIDCTLIFLIAILHFVSFFLIKKSDFTDIFDTYESSPLFEFKIDSENQEGFSNVIFHVWHGIKKDEYKRRKRYTVKKGETQIDKLKGSHISYKSISYKDLLYNNQIRKLVESYSGEYTKDCGVIDTLGQHLYIKDGEDCPLNDISINDNEPKIVLNNNDNNNKKIIGKLILNDGQPCYKSGEKLWRKFIDDEYADEHLECEVQVFGKLTDDRYINRGSVTYDEIYHENLDQEYYDMMKNKLGDYKVSLYSREFIGIDKQCDEKTSVTREQNKKLNKSQKDISRVFIVEGVINLCLSIDYFVIFIIWVCCHRNNTKYKYIVNVGYNILLSEMIITLGCLIAQAVYLSRIKKNDISYQCSDEITNELFRTQKDITNKSITYSWIFLSLWEMSLL